MDIRDIATAAALLFGIVNLALIFARIGHDVKLRKTEIAMRMVDAEYKRIEISLSPGFKAGVPLFAPNQVLDIYLPVVDEIYRTGTFDPVAFDREAGKKAERFRSAGRETEKPA
jgi:hypothetical protein